MPVLPLRHTLESEGHLGSLMQRVAASRRCLEAITPLLPEGLRGQGHAGPLDDKGWTLLATHAAAAAKLRQLVPSFEACLRDHGLAGTPVRVKVLPPA